MLEGPDALRLAQPVERGAPDLASPGDASSKAEDPGPRGLPRPQGLPSRTPQGRPETSGRAPRRSPRAPGGKTWTSNLEVGTRLPNRKIRISSLEAGIWSPLLRGSKSSDLGTRLIFRPSDEEGWPLWKTEEVGLEVSNWTLLSVEKAVRPGLIFLWTRKESGDRTGPRGEYYGTESDIEIVSRRVTRPPTGPHERSWTLWKNPEVKARQIARWFDSCPVCEECKGLRRLRELRESEGPGVEGAFHEIGEAPEKTGPLEQDGTCGFSRSEESQTEEVPEKTGPSEQGRTCGFSPRSEEDQGETRGLTPESEIAPGETVEAPEETGSSETGSSEQGGTCGFSPKGEESQGETRGLPPDRERSPQGFSSRNLDWDPNRTSVGPREVPSDLLREGRRGRGRGNPLRRPSGLQVGREWDLVVANALTGVDLRTIKASPGDTLADATARVRLSRRAKRKRADQEV